jgi:hypothetical protein
MKRFAVLFGMLAVVVACGTSYATAPQVRDMPDIRLDTGADTCGLPQLATDAYDVMDYFLDVDDAPASLTVSILNVQMIAAPGAGGADPDPAANVDIDGATQATADAAQVDVYGRATAGWQQYTVRVDDASTVLKGVGGDAAISDAAVAKYSTFALNEPTIEDGVFLVAGGEGATTRQFVYCWLGGTQGDLYRLDVAIDPASASAGVDWTLEVSDLVAEHDANGSYLGLDPQYAAGGAACNYEGLYYSIDTDGALTLTSGGSVSPGPWIVGILATNQADEQDSDGSRILVANAMVPEATPDTATVGTSVTFDDLTPATITAATDVYLITTNTPAKGASAYVGGVAPAQTDNIATNCGWLSNMSGPNDTVLDSVDLEIVDLSLDGDLPVAAQLVEGNDTAHIAGGNAIKATFPTVSGTPGPRGVNPAHVQLPAFRLGSRAFTGVASTDIITFALSVATDASQATDLPKYQIYAGSGFAGSLAGADVRFLKSLLQSVDGADFTAPQTNMPQASQGWHTVSVTYAPGATVQWFNVDGDTDMDGDDLAIMSSLTVSEGWDGANELDVCKVGFVCSTHQMAENPVNIWVDNLRVFQSAYALDLALGAEELTETLRSGDNSALDMFVGWGVTKFTTGDIDGTIESAAGASDANLLDIGIVAGMGGAGNAAAFEHFDKDYVEGTLANCFSIGTQDHTRNDSSSQSIRIALAGDDGADGWSGALDSVRAQMATGDVAGSGDGLYCLEAYIAKLNACNQVNTYRHPGVRAIIQEVAPNYYGSAAGVIFTNGGLPEAVTGDPPGNWQRAVIDLYIPNCDVVRGLFQVMDTFKADVGNFAVPIFIDDVALYKVDDPALFFDADLFDGV